MISSKHDFIKCFIFKFLKRWIKYVSVETGNDEMEKKEISQHLLKL